MDEVSSLSPAIAIERPMLAGPVVVSVPHAGRLYPPRLLKAARVAAPVLEKLEDRWCDGIAAHAAAAGATVVKAMWARAVADCNRGEGQMAPSEVAVALRPRFSAPGRKERAGLGVVPTRLVEAGPLWKRPIDAAELGWRLDTLHRPYHAALAAELERARQRHGHAVLIDLHSMPSIPAGQPGHGAAIVIGDRHGDSCGDWLTELTQRVAERLDIPVSRNQPYPGGHIIRTHGRPDRGDHAVQIEIDRRLYLDAARDPDPAGMARMRDWFAMLLAEVARAAPFGEARPIAAE